MVRSEFCPATRWPRVPFPLVAWSAWCSTSAQVAGHPSGHPSSNASDRSHVTCSGLEPWCCSSPSACYQQHSCASSSGHRLPLGCSTNGATLGAAAAAKEVVISTCAKVFVWRCWLRRCHRLVHTQPAVRLPPQRARTRAGQLWCGRGHGHRRTSWLPFVV